VASGPWATSAPRSWVKTDGRGGASPAYVMSQMGHASSALALEVYARKMERQRDTGARMDALVRGADWATMGSNSVEALPAKKVESNT